MDISLDYIPHENQKKLHDDKHRYIVVCAGRRFGKSKFARNHCILNAIYNPGLYWIVNPTYRQGKQIHWRDLKKEIPEELVKYKNEQELSIHLINGSIIEIKGADNEDALRGVGLKGVVLDEAADQKPLVWEEIIRPTLVDSEGWAIFIGTPKGFNWFYELYQRGQKGTKQYKISNPDSNDPDWSSYKFKSYDNPTLKKKEIDKAKKETDEDTFIQEYLAEFKKAKGLIYKKFDPEVHVIEPFDLPMDDTWEYYRVVDFGYGANPTACLWVGIDPDGKWYIFDEYYETKDTSDYHCGIILGKTGSIPITLTFCDPANPAIIETWNKNGVYLTRARRPSGTTLGNWVGTGIDIIAERLKVSVIDRKPQLFVFNNCENVIREFQSYKWKEERNSQLNNPGRPEKANDHAMDALRYFAISYLGKQNIDYEDEMDHKNWSFR